MAENNGNFLNEIKAGDKVWVGESRYGKKLAKILPVLSRTATLIRVPYPGDGSPHNFRITKWEHDGSWHAYESPSRMFSEEILDVATAAEYKAYDAERVRKNEEWQAQESEKQTAEEKRNELQGLFGERVASVGDAQWGTTEERKGLFDVTFHGLTEMQTWQHRGTHRRSVVRQRSRGGLRSDCAAATRRRGTAVDNRHGRISAQETVN